MPTQTCNLAALNCGEVLLARALIVVAVTVIEPELRFPRGNGILLLRGVRITKEIMGTAGLTNEAQSLHQTSSTLPPLNLRGTWRTDMPMPATQRTATRPRPLAQE